MLNKVTTLREIDLNVEMCQKCEDVYLFFLSFM